MHAPSGGQKRNANRQAVKVVGFRDTDRESTVIDDDLTDRICVLIHALSPTKAARFLALYGDVGERQAERIIGGQQAISWPVLRALLTSEHASRFAGVMMDSFGDNKFWMSIRRQLRLANLREQKRALEQELRDLEDSA